MIGSRLRRHEGFFFTWKDDPAIGDGRSSIWLENSIPLFFKFSKSARHELNREWLDQLTIASHQAQGLFLTGEPDEEPPRPRSNV